QSRAHGARIARRGNFRPEPGADRGRNLYQRALGIADDRVLARCAGSRRQLQALAAFQCGTARPYRRAAEQCNRSDAAVRAAAVEFRAVATAARQSATGGAAAGDNYRGSRAACAHTDLFALAATQSFAAPAGGNPGVASGGLVLSDDAAAAIAAHQYRPRSAGRRAVLAVVVAAVGGAGDRGDRRPALAATNARHWFALVSTASAADHFSARAQRYRQ